MINDAQRIHNRVNLIEWTRPASSSTTTRTYIIDFNLVHSEGCWFSAGARPCPFDSFVTRCDPRVQPISRVTLTTLCRRDSLFSSSGLTIFTILFSSDQPYIRKKLFSWAHGFNYVNMSNNSGTIEQNFGAWEAEFFL